MRKFFVLVGFAVVLGLSAWILAANQEYRQSYEQMLRVTLDSVENTVNEAVNSAEEVGLYSPSLVYREADNIWEVAGVAHLRGLVGEAVHAKFSANLELLCEPPSELDCWRVESLVVGETILATAGHTLGPISLLTLSGAEALNPSEELADTAVEQDDQVPEDPQEARLEGDTAIEGSATDDPAAMVNSAEQLPEQALTRRIQQMLRQLGYSPGQPDGVIGPRTTSAILAYQRRNGLTADGLPSQQLLNHLIAARAAEASNAQ